MAAGTVGRRRSPVPWLYGLAGLLVLLCPLVFLGVWVADGGWEGFGAALLAGIADLVAAVVAAVTATVLAAQRGVRRVRTVVSGHPDGRDGRLAEHHAARWAVARERFAGLQREYAAFEADPTAVAARPALTDVSVPATARFVDAYADAAFLATDTEPAGPRREEFAAAVDRAVAAWHEAGRTAEALAGVAPTAPQDRVSRHDDPPHLRPTRAVGPAPTVAAPPPGGTGRPASEYGEAADAVRRAAARGVRDLRDRLRT